MHCKTCNSENVKPIEIMGSYVEDQGTIKHFDGLVPICRRCIKSVQMGLKFISIGDIIKKSS